MKKKSEKDLESQFQDDDWLKEVYIKLLPQLEKHVLRNSGTAQDAKDLFQEAMVITYKKTKDPSFILTSSIETFIFSVGKRKWLYELRKRKEQTGITEPIEDEGNTIEEIIIKDEKQKLYLQHFNQLSPKCQEVLKLFFSGLKMNEIAKNLGFSSEGYTRKRKHECQDKLLKQIKSDPVYKEMEHE